MISRFIDTHLSPSVLVAYPKNTPLNSVVTITGRSFDFMQFFFQMFSDFRNLLFRQNAVKRKSGLTLDL